MDGTTQTHQRLTGGKWTDNLSWEFYLHDKLPEPSLCTAVYCLAVLKESDAIRLARINRGWEMLGGHIEPNESIDEALVRECLEEGGFMPEAYAPYGYIQVMAKQPVSNRHGGYYPQTSFIPHFIAITNSPLRQPSGEEVFEAGSFDLKELAGLSTAHEDVIRAGMARYADIKDMLIERLSTPK